MDVMKADNVKDNLTDSLVLVLFRVGLSCIFSSVTYFSVCFVGCALIMSYTCDSFH